MVPYKSNFLDGTCGDGLLVPNHNRTYCALAGRVDVGKHHIIGGGPTSKKLFIESIKKQIGTVFFQQHFSQDEDINSGLKYFFNLMLKRSPYDWLISSALR